MKQAKTIVLFQLTIILWSVVGCGGAESSLPRPTEIAISNSISSANIAFVKLASGSTGYSGSLTAPEVMYFASPYDAFGSTAPTVTIPLLDGEKLEVMYVDAGKTIKLASEVRAYQWSTNNNPNGADWFVSLSTFVTGPSISIGPNTLGGLARPTK
jgi:hypothetical protein